MGFEIKIANPKELLKELEALKTTGEKVLGATVKDMKARAPTQVAKAVTEVYNISATELKPPTTKTKIDENGDKKQIRKAGSVRIEGDSIQSLRLVYHGRLLTPLKFGMQPKKPTYKKLEDRYVVHVGNTDRERYFLAAKYNATPKITAKIKKKGGRKALREYKENKRVFLGTTGNSNVMIPFTTDEGRRGTELIVPIKRVAVPQMIWDRDVKSDIDERLKDLLSKRFEHHSKRFNKKK